MRIFTIVLYLLCCTTAHAQKKTEAFYDYNWEPCSEELARFYGEVVKTDSGWLRSDYFISGMKLQMRGLYEDKECKKPNGHFTYYHANGNLSQMGKLVGDNRQGIYTTYYFNGMMADSAKYENGIFVGHRSMWHRNGFPSDSIAHINDSLDVQVSWFDDGPPAAAGYLLHGKKHGKWVFYHHNGAQSAVEVYNKGDVVSEKYFNEDQTPMTDLPKANVDASFKGGSAAWRKYILKKFEWPTGLQFTNSGIATIGVQFIIDESGQVQDVEVVVPFHPEFDKIAVNIIKQSPAWNPAVKHNRKAKFAIRQPVTFEQL